MNNDRIERLLGIGGAVLVPVLGVARDQAAALGSAMSAGVAVAILVAISLPEPVHAQSSADEVPVILLHPRVATVLQLPDKIDSASVFDRGELRTAIVGDKLYIRPWPGTPAGMEASLDVETRTARQTFRLRVVARARDANREIRVLPVEAQAPEESTPEAPAEPEVPPEASTEPEVPPEIPAEPEAPPVAVTPEAAAPAASAPASTPSPVPTGDPEPPEKPAEPAAAADMERKSTVTTGVPRFDLSAHLVIGLGVTALDFAGYDPRDGFQRHYAFGVRLAGEPPGGWWALEVELSGESLAGPLAYAREAGSLDLDVRGAWLRGMLGMRVQGGIRWMPSIYAGIGAHAHLRETTLPEGSRSSTMEHGGVLALGTGLQYRTRDILLGFDVQVRLGGLDDYRSIAAFLTVGRVLDQGE
jgi:hypothetical protein